MLYSDINQEQMFKDAEERGGNLMSVNMTLEEISELIQAINKYFNRRVCDAEYVATEIADVEICIDRIMLQLDKNNINELADIASANSVLTRQPPDYIRTCANALLVICSYFHFALYDWTTLTATLAEMKVLCNDLRKVIGDDLVDEQKIFKTLRLYNIVYGTNNESNND